MTCDLRPDDLPYRLGPRAGAGGAGEVFRATAPDGRAVAVKLSFASDDAAAMRARREAALVARMPPATAPRVEGFGRLADGRTYLAMEWLDGGALTDRLSDAPWSVAEVARLGRTLALALAAAHEAGIVHRDLKPDNVLFRADGAAVLTDFGLARTEDDPGSSATRCAGTPLSMAPEQVLGDPLGPATDLYALGVLLYRLRRGRDLFDGNVVELQLAHLGQPAPPLPASAEPGSAALAALVAELLRKRPEERPVSARAVAARLAALVPSTTAWPRRLAVAAIAALAVAASSGPSPTAALAWTGTAPIATAPLPSAPVTQPPTPTPSAATDGPAWALATAGTYSMKVRWRDDQRAGDRLPVAIEVWNDDDPARLDALAATIRDPAGEITALTGAALAGLELAARRAGDYMLTVFAPDGDVTLSVTIPVGPAPSS